MSHTHCEVHTVPLIKIQFLQYSCAKLLDSEYFCVWSFQSILHEDWQLFCNLGLWFCSVLAANIWWIDVENGVLSFYEIVTALRENVTPNYTASVMFNFENGDVLSYKILDTSPFMSYLNLKHIFFVIYFQITTYN
jgi:hypothetical protein